MLSRQVATGNALVSACYHWDFITDIFSWNAL